MRAILPAGVSGAAVAATMEPWRTLTTEEVEKQRLGDSIVLTIPPGGGEQPGAHWGFAVRTLTRGFRNRPRESGLSNIVTLTMLQVPGAIQGLQARTTETAIELSWNAPAMPVTAYRLFRSPTGRADAYRMIAEMTELVYHDSDFTFGRSYFYKVTAIVKGNGSTAASEDSIPVEITPRDTFPPKPPQELTAVYTTQAIELIWNASSEVDLRGYIVYRREENLGQVKVTPKPLSTPIYRDGNVTTGKNYTYRVTGVDSAGNESDYSVEATVEVR
ncbi:MAG: hypothetical protein HY508_02490 [Acidobacteria bacterium]|nr:hypothetical protein [Acidobacteriota bacterium]